MSTLATAIAQESRSQGINPLQQVPIAKPLKTFNRYIWQPAEDIPHEEATLGYITTLREMAKRLQMDVPISGNFVERCRIAPVLPALKWDRWMDVPAELRRTGRDPDGQGNYHEASYQLEPGDIFDGFMADYKHWGCVELIALRGMAVEEFIALQIDEAFFPERKDRSAIGPDGNPLDLIPKAYSTLRARIATVTANPPVNERERILREVARDMLLAIDVAEAFDTQLVDAEETRTPLQYSKRGLRALDRLERQRRDHAMNEMAKVQKAAFEKMTETAPAPAVGITPDTLEMILNRVEEKTAERFDALVSKLNPPPPPAEAVPAVTAPAKPKPLAQPSK